MKITKYRPNINYKVLFLGTVSLISFSGIVRAEVNPSNFVQSGYWYEDEDIRGILKLKTGDNAYIAPALPFESRELVKDIIVASLEQVKQSGSALIPINFGNSHWVALALRKGEGNSVKAIYNDSFGSALSNTTNGSYVLEVLQEIDPTIELIDLQVRQQSDGSSCGAFTAENLAVIASLDISTLSQDQLNQTTSKYDYASAYNKSFLTFLLEHIFLISVGLISVSLISQNTESFFPRLAEIPRSSYLGIIIKYFRGHALSNQDEINFLIPALYFLLVLYFIKVFHDLQISILSFLLLFALWIILILILNTTILEYPLTILTIFLINLINHVLPEEQIAGQELIINSFYILSSFCLFKALMLSVVSISNSTRGNILTYQNEEYDNTNS